MSETTEIELFEIHRRVQSCVVLDSRLKNSQPQDNIASKCVASEINHAAAGVANRLLRNNQVSEEANVERAHAVSLTLGPIKIH